MPMLALTKISWVPTRTGWAKLREDPAGELAGVLGIVQSRHDDGELVATQSGHLRSQGGGRGSDLVLPLSAAGPKPRGHMAEELVAHLMAQRIVDPAEVIEVDEERRHQALVPAGLLQGVGQPLLV